MMKCIGGNMVMKKCCGVLRIAVGMILLGLLFSGSANAATLTVCLSGCEYSSIQKAIIASSNGDTILVKGGTYLENVKVNKKLTLRGVGNPVVNAGGRGNAIMLSANGISLEGFTATGSGGYSAGIKVTSNNNTLTGNNASNNGNEYGGFGIYLSSSNNNTLIGNNASNNFGGGIYLRKTRRSALSDNIMIGNKINFGLDGDNNSDFNNYIDASNLVEGKPIYYIIKASDTTYDSSSNAGTFYCISCVNVTIKNLNLYPLQKE